MTTAAFATIRDLLAPYEKHFTRLYANDPNVYDLQDDRDHARTTFAELVPWKGGARFIFYPLKVFPELVATLPATLQPAFKQKYVLDFVDVTAAQKAALRKLVEAAWSRVAAHRAIAPAYVYSEKLSVEDSLAIATRLFGKAKDVSVAQTKAGIAITLPPKAKIPAAFAKTATKQTIKLKTLTPADHAALAAIAAKL